jgi:hypothetical protein
MTGYSTTINAGYGQGVYVASASSELNSNYTAWMAFDRGLSTSGVGYWVTPFTLYNSVSPWNYSGSVTTNDVSGVSYVGEWLQIYIPNAIVVSSYTITPNLAAKAPSKFWIMGSRDCTSWYLVDSRSGVTSWSINTPIVFNVATSQCFNYFRIICGNLTSTPASSQYGIEITEWVLNGTIESVNITADGRVGLGVVAPVQALEVAGSGVFAGTVSAGTGLMFRNRIINGDMRIAQRGTSLTGQMGTNTYLIDRWVIEAYIITGQYTYNQISLLATDTPYQCGFKYAANIIITTALTNYVVLTPSQRIENINISDLNWGTTFGSPVTVSLWIKTNAAAGSTVPVSIRANYSSTLFVYPYNATIIASGVWQFVSFTVPPPPGSSTPIPFDNSSNFFLYIGNGYQGTPAIAGTWTTTSQFGSSTQTNIYSAVNVYFSWTGVQLEKGTIATPFEVRPYGVELQLCQRYYYQINSLSLYTVFCQGSFIGSTTIAQCLVNFPVTMRTFTTNFSASAPTTFFFGSGSGNTCTEVAIINGTQSKHAAQVRFITSSAVTAGTGCIIEAANTTSAFLAFSAEL